MGITPIVKHKCIALMTVAFLFNAPFSSVYSQEPANNKARVYKHDFEGQDLADRDFTGQNLDDANFEDANLKNVQFDNCSLKNCNFQGANLDRTDFTRADLTNSDLRNSLFGAYFHLTILNKADLSGLDLKRASTSEMKMRETKLRGTKGFNQIYGTDFSMADLRGADFSTAVLFDRTVFRKAKYDSMTRWPSGFDVKSNGLVMVETKATDETAPQGIPPRNSNNSEAAFQKLDRNEDGVLSGSEVQGFKEKDANGDGEVTLSEFLSNGSSRD